MSQVVHVRNTADDYVAAQRVLTRGQASVWRRVLWLLPAIAVLVVVLLGVPALVTTLFKINPMFAFLVSAPLGYYLYFRIWRFTARRRVTSMLSPSGPFLSPADIELAPDGVHWRNHRGEGRTNWHAVPRVEQAGALVLVYIDTASAHVIPRRCFASNAEVEDFISVARGYIAGAKTP